MGCVQSSQQRRSARAKQARRQKLYEQQNFHPKPRKTPSKGDAQLSPEVIEKTATVHKNNTNSASTPGGMSEEIQFRRQHFDRNSMLRHSKKRRRSTSSANPTSPGFNHTDNKSFAETPNTSSNRKHVPETDRVIEFRKEETRTLEEETKRISETRTPEYMQRKDSGRLI